MVYQFGNDSPLIAAGCYIAESAQVIGKVRIDSGASVWMGAVLRGDIEEITLGRNSNVQDNCSLHTSSGLPLHIGTEVSIGHGATLHSCQVGAGSLIGMGATVLDGAVIGAGSLVAAGSLVLSGQKFVPHSLIVGSPAKHKRELTPAARQQLLAGAQLYTDLSQSYQSELVALAPDQQQWKLAVYVPTQPPELIGQLKEALFAAGAGGIGLYRKCSWQVEGQGQFLPQSGSQPAVGAQGQLTCASEYKLELLTPAQSLQAVLEALHRAHPYQTPAYEVYPVYSRFSP